VYMYVEALLFFWHVARLDDNTPANMALHPNAWIENSVPEHLKFSKIREF